MTTETTLCHGLGLNPVINNNATSSNRCRLYQIDVMFAGITLGALTRKLILFHGGGRYTAHIHSHILTQGLNK